MSLPERRMAEPWDQVLRQWRSPRGPLSSVPPLLTRGGDPVLPLTAGSLEVEATWGFHGGSDGEEASREVFNIVSLEPWVQTKKTHGRVSSSA